MRMEGGGGGREEGERRREMGKENNGSIRL